MSNANRIPPAAIMLMGQDPSKGGQGGQGGLKNPKLDSRPLVVVLMVFCFDVRLKLGPFPHIMTDRSLIILLNAVLVKFYFNKINTQGV